MIFAGFFIEGLLIPVLVGSLTARGGCDCSLSRVIYMGIILKTQRHLPYDNDGLIRDDESWDG